MNKTDKLLKKLSPKQRKLIDQSLALLFVGKTQGLDIKPLSGLKGVYRLRVGQYRVLYRKLTGKEIEILGIRKRDDQTYRDF